MAVVGRLAGLRLIRSLQQLLSDGPFSIITPHPTHRTKSERGQSCQVDSGWFDGGRRGNARGNRCILASETIAGLGVLKTAFEMAKALESMHEATVRDRAVIDLQKEILTALSAQSALISRKQNLKKKWLA